MTIDRTPHACDLHAPQPMTPADAAWLQMEHPANRMIITSLMTFDARLDEGALKKVLERVAAIPRFHQRVVPVAGLIPRVPEWRDDPRFDLRAHVHHVGLPAPAGEAELRRFVSERMSATLDPEKPLWELDVIDRGSRGSALLLRVHHCVGDGVALVRVLLGLCDDPGAIPHQPGKRKERAAPGLVEWAGLQIARARTFLQMLALPADPPTFRCELGLVKRAAWSGPIPLPRLRSLAREHQATVNDVLMGTLAGVLRGSLIEAGAPAPARDIRAMVPVFLGARDGEMGNRFGLAFVDLPVGEAEANARIRRVKERMDAVKTSLMAPVAFDVLQAFGVAGRFVEQLGVEIFSRKTSVMVTNVPGPRQKLHMAGEEIRSIMVWAPTAGRLGFSVTLLSYGGELRIGIAADAHLGFDPDALVERFERDLTAGAPAGPVRAEAPQASA